MAKVNYYESEISHDLKQLKQFHPHLYTHRFTDTALWRYALQNKSIFAPKQPCDELVLYSGLSFYIELKSSRSPTSYSWQYISPHQVSDLLHIEHTDTNPQRSIYSYFFINKRTKSKPLQTFALRAHEVNDIISSGKKSIKWAALQDIATEIPRVKGTWDLLPFFKSHLK